LGAVSDRQRGDVLRVIYNDLKQTAEPRAIPKKKRENARTALNVPALTGESDENCILHYRKSFQSKLGLDQFKLFIERHIEREPVNPAFHKPSYRYHILTSKGIQERYFDAVSRRKSVDVKKGYLLIPYAKISGNANIIEENADISGENAYIFEERSEEEE